MSTRAPKTSRVLLIALVVVWIAVLASSFVVFRQYRSQRGGSVAESQRTKVPRAREATQAPEKPLATEAGEKLLSSGGDGGNASTDVVAPLPPLHFDASDEYDALLRQAAAPTKVATQVAQCDVDTVPFANHRGCEEFMSNPAHWLRFVPLAPKFEQRTIKFRLAFVGGLEAIVKVPQALFPTEPFSEVGACLLDRRLGILRVPPTALVPVNVHMLAAVAAQLGSDVEMVEEFNPKNLTWAQWVAKDFVEFVTQEKSGHLMANATHVWCSFQPVMREVVPLLVSQLKLPYSKQNSGWHRWFNPAWEGYVKMRHNPSTNAALMAVSQLAMFDFVTLNNDRSPNKNNFVVKGCVRGNCNANKKPSARAAKGLHATFLHLDQGMAFNGFQQPHNPIAKPKNGTFCSFYGPFLESVQRYVAGVEDTTAAAAAATKPNRSPRKKVVFDAIQADLMSTLPASVVGMIGKNKLWLVGQNMVRLLDRAAKCVAAHGRDRVLVTARSTWLSSPP